MKRTMKYLSVVLALAIGLMPAAALAAASVDPASVTVTLKPGESTTVAKRVTTAEIPSTPDIYFLADTTGSMSAAIAAVQTGAASIMTSVTALDSSAQFGVGDYKDTTDAYCFRNGQAVTGDATAVSTAMAAWAASGGGNWPEGQLYALYKLATDSSIGWRTGSSRVVVWFGDAPANDPISASYTGLSFDVTEAVVIQALQNAGIMVIAVDTGSLNAYGQATRIAAATGGVYCAGVAPSDIVSTILGSLSEVKTDISATIVADPGLTVTLDPAVREGVATGTTVNFTEKISVASTSTATVLHATVAFSASGAAIGTETITVNVPQAIPSLPKTGIGPDQSLLWTAIAFALVVLAGFAGFAYKAWRQSADSSV